jgi:predicted N-acetyltransferase YhbS
MPIVPLATVDPAKIEALLDRAFGPERRVRTAYKIRVGLTPIAGLSFASIDDEGTLVGSIQSWPVALHGDDGVMTPLVMVGPVAVEPAIQRGGIGRALTEHMLGAASDLPLMLIGDPEYYERWFGFSAKRTGGWRLPGPFEPHRLLARGDGVPVGPGELIGRKTS